MFSIRTRIVASYLFMIGLAFFALIFASSRIIGNYLIDLRVTQQQKQTEELAGTVAPYLYNYDAAGLYETVREKSLELDGRILVFSKDGVVQCESFSQLNGRKLDHKEIISAVQNGVADYGFHRIETDVISQQGEDTAKTWVAYYATPVTMNGERIGAVLFSSGEINTVISRLATLNVQIFLVLLGVSFISVALGLVVSRYIIKPVRELTDAATTIAGGRFDRRVQVSGRSEMAHLAETFNMMSEKLESLDHVRNEFVSNASHELKTPLSSIKILTESLLYQPFDEKITKEFLTDINSEVDRMSEIVNDLLALVNMDNESSRSIRKEVVHLEPLLKTVVESLQSLARLNQITLKLEIKNDITIMGDSLRLRQAFTNLIDNGLKYTGAGGEVKVSLRDEGRWAVISVKDNGIGIPEKEQKHIFERFYRVDKARSRYTGGTGLGLSIVKNIVTLHEGDISLSSREGVGSEFVVKLSRV
ncbi:MAG: sensor histidine kinase [Christensenellales bacterium]